MNYSATLLWHLYQPTAIVRDYLWGTVIVTGGPDPDQHIQPVPEDVIAHYAALRAMLRTADTL